MVSGATGGEFDHRGEPLEITRCNLLWCERNVNLVSASYSSTSKNARPQGRDNLVVHS